MHTRFNELLPRIETKDGLVPSGEIIVNHSHRWHLRQDGSVEVFPHWRVRPVADLLISLPAIWPSAAVRLTPTVPGHGRAPVYGVPLDRAIEIALSQGSMKSRYQVPSRHKQNGTLYAQLFVRVVREKKSAGSTVVIECWEWIGEGEEVYYAHVILDPQLRQATHYDGALLEYATEFDVTRMFDTSTKQKGLSYKKYFRVDGTVPLAQVIDVMRNWFPVTELVEEYFEWSPNWPRGIR